MRFFSSGRLHCGVFSGAVGGLHALFRVGRLDSSLYRKRRIRRTLAFILLWIGVPVGLSLLAYMLTKAVETVKLGGLNRLGGALLGGLKYMVFLSCALNVAFRIHLISGSTGEHSRLYHPVRAMSDKLFDVCKTHVVRVVEDAASPACGQDPKKQLR